MPRQMAQFFWPYGMEALARDRVGHRHKVVY